MAHAAFLPIGPEIVLLAGALVVILAAVVFERPRLEWGIVAGTSLVVAFALAVAQWRDLGDEVGRLFFTARGLSVFRSPMVVMDHYSAAAGIILFGIGFLGLLAAWDLVTTLESRGAEFVTLLLLAVAGLHGMAISANLVLLFLALEVASISFYVLAAFTRERIEADEAALKYFLLGSMASAVFVYGVALAFAATGSLSIYGAGGIRDFLSTTIVTRPGILLLAMALLIVGMAFKVSAAPFHQWAPDVYQGAPGGATGLMAAGVKVAGFVALGRVLVGAFPARMDDWVSVVAIVAGLSVVIGTLLAAVQDDVKRLLAYSGVAHAGYILIGLTAGSAGIPAMLFYVGTYPVLLLGAFAVAAVVSGSRRGRSPLDDWAGLARRSPELAYTMAALMLGLAGIPFTAGFVGKVTVFTAAVDAGEGWLVVLGLLTTVIGLYFYLKVIGTMFIREPVAAEAPGAAPAIPEASATTRVVLAVAVAVTFVLGVYPWPILDALHRALPL